MVIDTSALPAILFAEPEAADFAEQIASADHRLVGGPTFVETTAVMLARKGWPGVIALDALLARLGIDIVPLSVEAAEFARQACARYGKGVGSPAVLNHGDVLSYGVARAEGEDFPQTDIVPAV
jgi:ribonuclease VapC